MAESTTIRAFIDRFEGENAVLLLGSSGEATARLPRACLPAGAGEGTHLILSLTVDSGAARSLGVEVERLMNDLQGGGSP